MSVCADQRQVRRVAASSAGDGRAIAFLVRHSRPVEAGCGWERSSNAAAAGPGLTIAKPKHSPAAGRPEHEADRPAPRSLPRAGGRMR